jgi:hypothetical protein
MKYATDMGSSSVINITSFVMIGSDIQKLIRGRIQRHTDHGDSISLLLFFKIRKTG